MKETEKFIEKIARSKYPKRHFQSKESSLSLKTNTEQTMAFTIFLVITLVLQTQIGWANPDSMETLSMNIIDKVFQPWIRKTLAAFSGAWGMFKAYGAGSFSPLVIWGGLALAIQFIPAMIKGWF